MTDFVASDDNRGGADRAESLAAMEQGFVPDTRCVPPHPAAATACPQPTAATEGGSRSILIVATVAALSWAIVIGFVIAALATS